MNNKFAKKTTVFCLTASFLSAGMVSAKSNDNQTFSVVAQPTHTVSAGLQVEQKRVEYIWPSPQQAMSMEKMQSRSSNEYWEKVTGAQLKKGVRLYSQSADALIRLAPSANNGIQADTLNKDLLKITDKSQLTPVQFNKLASQKAMEEAGFSDGSVALKLALTANLSAMYLKSEQALSDKAEYLLHVKEKNSPVTLNVSAPRFFQDTLERPFELDATMANNALDNSRTQVRLIAPNNAASNATFNNGNVSFFQPLSNVGAYQGYYDLELTSTANINGQAVKRTIKLPFVNLVQTAQLQPRAIMEGTSTQPVISVPVNIHEPGRYAVTATLEGFDPQGNQVKMQTVEVAQWMSSSNQLSLPFDFGKLQGFTGPYSLSQVKLTDQSRMMVLQQHTRFAPVRALDFDAVVSKEEH